MKEYTIMKAYRNDDALRESFNELAKSTFGLDFEDWYQNGYWQDFYIPYSVIENGKVIANISVNIMEFELEGEKKKLIQLGTVMTEESHRNKGLIGKLMSEVMKDYDGVADGFFLFANDNVLEFYPKFGFKKAMEYQFSREVDCKDESCAVQIPMKNKSDWSILEQAIEESVSNGSFEQNENVSLTMFYISKFMQGNVYFVENQKAYVIAEVEENDLFIHTIFSKERVDLNRIIAAFGDISHVTLGFTPTQKEGYKIAELYKEDTTIFILGNMDFLEEKKIMIPTLSHA